MSSSDDSTRPISVAELLARNGTIGSPPVGGHRRRRRRKSDSVSVAELTGEIPVVREEGPPPAAEETVAEESAAEEAVAEEPAAEVSAAEEPVAEEAVAEEPVADEPVADEAVADEAVAEEPAAEESAADEAVAEEPVADEAVADETVAEEPVSEEQVAEEAAAEEAVTGQSVAQGAEAEEETAAPQVAADEDVAAEETVAEEEAVAEEEEEAAAEDFQPAELEEVTRDGVTENAEAVIHEALTEDVITDTVEAAPASRPVESPPLSSDPLPSRRSGPERGYDPRPARKPAFRAEQASGAEQMAPDPVDQSVDLADLVDDQGADAEELRSYLRASGGTLFSGETVADERSRLGPVTDVIEPVEAAAPVARRGALSLIWHGVLATLQSLLAVVFGAGLFIAFDQLWRWNNIVALVLSVLVILGLVVAVRLVRKTEDITSTLIAVAVGALVTLGPLALLQST